MWVSRRRFEALEDQVKALTDATRYRDGAHTTSCGIWVEYTYYDINIPLADVVRAILERMGVKPAVVEREARVELLDIAKGRKS